MVRGTFGRAARGAAAIISVALVTLATRPSSAEPTEEEVKTARKVFHDAELLEDAQRWDEALDKLHTVEKVRRTAGVVFHIAWCEQHRGNLVKALRGYEEAAKLAESTNAQDVIKLVGDKQKDLRDRVPRLILHMPPEAPDAQVTIDGEPVKKEELTTSVPVDPGTRRLEIHAPGRSPFLATLVFTEHDRKELDIKLPEEPKPTPPAPTPTPTPPGPPPTSGRASTPAPSSSTAASTSTDSGHRSRAGAVLATIGAVVLVGGGVASFILAGSSHDSARDECATRTTSCDDLKGGPRTWDALALGAWVGGAALGTLAVILWTSSGDRAPASAALSFGAGRVTLGGSF